MNAPSMINIQKAQNEYLELLLGYEEFVRGEDLSIIKICELLDEINCFWLERLKIIEFELDELTDTKMCFALFGAVFLDTSDYEHYYFKSFGDAHIIPDSLLKLDVFFRIPPEKLNYNFTTDYFKKAYFNTIKVLTIYKGYFLILPINEIVLEYADERNELIDSFFWKFLSSAFETEFRNREEFYEKFRTFEEIDKGLIGFFRQNLIFNDVNDLQKSLSARIQRYQADQDNISTLNSDRQEAEMFLIPVYSYVAQVADMLFICSILRVNPYIRFDVTFFYLVLVMNVFVEDIILREMIEKSIICYLFRKTFDTDVFSKYTFFDYCQRLEQNPMMNRVITNIRNSEINIFKEKTENVVSIIAKEFQSLSQD